MQQRLRLKFSRGEQVKYLSHLDLIRLWERALRRAHVPLAYSEGFTPHPRLSLAAPLAVGVTGEAELMDVWLTRPMAQANFLASVKQQLPDGISISDVWLISANLPSLQSQVHMAEYRVELKSDRNSADIEAAIAVFLAAEKLPWQHHRDTGVRRYDLRVLVDDIWLISHTDSGCVLGMKLRCNAQGSGRPEQVASALSFAGAPETIHRTKLIMT